MTLLEGFLKYKDKLHGYGMKLTKGNTAVVEEVLERLQLDVIENPREILPEAVRNYLYMSLKNNIVNYQKALSFKKVVYIESEENSVSAIEDTSVNMEARLASKQSVINFYATLEKMSKSKKQLARILYLKAQDYTYPEIAKMLNMNPETVKANVMVSKRNGVLEELKATLL